MLRFSLTDESSPLNWVDDHLHRVTCGLEVITFWFTIMQEFIIIIIIITRNWFRIGIIAEAL